ncbi:uncharacterized protein LOC126962211 [Macaca thibetana thibetana]|uniref:uncharacterized protein LOC126962211 n=1 Tax=Macaca thibetana thibetana TaxID=257877 RepID=UPI0021BCB9D8|nr:uncharacterized protein LOC126962211 [Macaca thibetana thibetana]
MAQEGEQIPGAEFPGRRGERVTGQEAGERYLRLQTQSWCNWKGGREEPHEIGHCLPALHRRAGAVSAGASRIMIEGPWQAGVENEALIPSPSHAFLIPSSLKQGRTGLQCVCLELQKLDSVTGTDSAVKIKLPRIQPLQHLKFIQQTSASLSDITELQEATTTEKGESVAITPIPTRLRKFSRARLPLWKLCKDWRNTCSHANKPQNKTRDAAFGLDFVQPGVTVPVKSPSRILAPGSSLGERMQQACKKADESDHHIMRKPKLAAWKGHTESGGTKPTEA